MGLPTESEVIIAIRTLLQTIENTETMRPGILETPARVIKSFGELYAGYKLDPKEILARTFDHEEPSPEVYEDVSVEEIPFFSQCEHHMLPFFGTVSIRYIPNGRVVGLSKLARLVDCFARRLQVQERIGRQIAQAIFDELQTSEVEVIIKGTHMCMCSRGVNKPGSVTVSKCVMKRQDPRTTPKYRWDFVKNAKITDSLAQGVFNAAEETILKGVNSLSLDFVPPETAEKVANLWDDFWLTEHIDTMNEYQGRFDGGTFVRCDNGLFKFWPDKTLDGLNVDILDYMVFKGGIRKEVDAFRNTFYYPLNYNSKDPDHLG